MAVLSHVVHCSTAAPPQHTQRHTLTNTHTHTLAHTHLYTQTHTETHLQNTHTHIQNFFSFSLYSLSNCSITDNHFSSPASALRSNPAHMRELRLNGSKARDSGVKHLSSLLE